MIEVELQKLIERARSNYAALSPLDRAIHDMEQRRSMSIGLSDFDKPIEEIQAQIDRQPEFIVLAELKRLLTTPPPDRAPVTFAEWYAANKHGDDCYQEDIARKAWDAALAAREAQKGKGNE